MDMLDQDPMPARIDFTKVNTGLPQIENFTDGGEEPISQTLTEHERHELEESAGLTAEQIDAATGVIVSIAAERGRRALEAYFYRYVQGQDGIEPPYGLAREAFADEESLQHAFDHADEYLYDALDEITTAYLGEV